MTIQDGEHSSVRRALLSSGTSDVSVIVDRRASDDGGLPAAS